MIAAGLCTASLLLASCAAPQTQALVDDPGGLPAQATVEDVPFHPQSAYHCGPAALAMALSWSGVPTQPEDLVGEVYIPGREGSFRTDLVASARRRGQLAVEIGDLGDLLGELAAGQPVIVFQNLSLDLVPQWHFAVVIGYDLTRREITLHSGLTRAMVTDLDAFERTWTRGDRWGLVVLSPDALPATAELDGVLDAAIGLERAGRPLAAARAYAAITRRWPESFAGWMGRGNTLYALDRAEEAETAFRRAIKTRGATAAAWNNLAYALAAQGRKDEARTAIERSLELDPANAARYRDTLRELGLQ